MSDYQCIDVEKIEEFFAGDMDIFKDFAQKFLASCTKLVDAIDTGIAERDPRAVQRAAHEYKGVISNLFCQDLLEVAQRLESMGASGSLGSEVPELFENLKKKHSVLVEELNRFTQD